MLIRFTVENYLSFSKRAEFSMIASQTENDKKHHIITNANDPESIPVLSSSILYGANEAGKSNMIKAIAFAKDFIVNGVDKNENIVLNKFRLNENCQDQPSRFEFEFKCKEKQYAYGFIINTGAVEEEWLYEIGINKEALIFERSNQTYTIDFEHALFEGLDDEERQRITFETKGTRENLLFLTNTRERNITVFDDIYNWFDDVLTIIFPDSTPGGLPLNVGNETDFFQNLISFFGFSIDRIDVQRTDIDHYQGLPSAFLKQIKESLIKEKLENKKAAFIPQFNLVIALSDEGKPEVLEFKSFRKDKSGKLKPFELDEESDGTRRIIELIPMLIMTLSKNETVIIIDEIERSLHVSLITKMFEYLLNSDTSRTAKGQIIATTHEVQLLNIKSLFRKDEIWFVEKNEFGESHFYSLANTDVEGLDLIKGYLQGRFGAIPFSRTSQQQANTLR